MLPTNSSLEPQSQKNADPRLESALAGEYSLTLKKIFDEAWEKTLGFKAVYWEAMGIALLIGIGMLIIGAVVYLAMSMILSHTPFDWQQLNKLLDSEGQESTMMAVIRLGLVYTGLFIFLPMLAGILMLAIRRVSSLPVRVGMLFSYYQKPWRYWLVDIWVNLFTQHIPTFVTGTAAKFLAGFIGSLATWLCIPLAITIALYAYISYFFAMPLLADRKLATWRALETSRRVVGRHWFEVCRAILLIILITLLIPAIVIVLLASNVSWLMMFLGIIFIWLIPFSALAMAILYRDVMGVFEKS